MSVPRFWREQPHRYNLEGTHCGNCDRIYFPPRGVCPQCRRASIGKMRPQNLEGAGTVVASSVVHLPAPGFEEQIPYAVAIVELDEGCRLTAHVTDCDPHEVQPGLRVHKVFRRLQQDGDAGVIYYGTKFVPAPSSLAAP